jgi:hypothetical protein
VLEEEEEEEEEEEASQLVLLNRLAGWLAGWLSGLLEGRRGRPRNATRRRSILARLRSSSQKSSGAGSKEEEAFS